MTGPRQDNAELRSDWATDAVGPMVTTLRSVSWTFDLGTVDVRALRVLYGGRRYLRRAKAAAQRARLGPCPAPIKRNRRKGWRRAR